LSGASISNLHCLIKTNRICSDIGMPDDIIFGTKEGLIARLSNALRGEQPVVFLLGAGVSMPRGAKPGVPAVDGVVKLVRSALHPQRRGLFDEAIRGHPNPYQAAFRQLIDDCGMAAANQVIRQAVLQARHSPHLELAPQMIDRAGLTDADCEKAERDHGSWQLPPAVQSLAMLAAHHPNHFGKTCLTTNFDPLVEIACARAGVPWFSTSLHGDGSLLGIRGSGLHIVHLHGYWFGTDTLHTESQLQQGRPRLAASIRQILKSSIFVAIGYGGWDDLLMSELAGLVNADDGDVEVRWAFYSSDEQSVRARYSHVIAKLGRAVARGRAHLYLGVDADELLLELFREITAAQPAAEFSLFLGRVAAALRDPDAYNVLSEPWNAAPGAELSLGEFTKLLKAFGHCRPALAGLFAVEYILPRLEHQLMHGPPGARAYTWVRPLVECARRLVQDGPNASDVRRLAIEVTRVDSYRDDAIEFDAGDAMILRAVELALRAAITCHDSTLEVVHEELGALASSEVYAAMAVHVVCRVLHDDNRALWEYIAARFSGWYDPLARLGQ
jgi:hypothetical protein